jgi:hypothetical protein
MISNRASVIVCGVAMSLVTALLPSAAGATSNGTAKEIARPIARVEPLLLADVVVQGNQPAPSPAPVAPAPVVVQPQAPSPVVEVPARHTTTIVEREPRNYMTTMFVSALMGGLAGALIGGSIYYLSDNQKYPQRIGFWAAGGVLVGAGVGLTQIMVQESRVDRATASRLPTDPVPTLRLALFQQRF